MNDFTKEELKFIAIALERYSIKDCELNNKIQYMIDSYCERFKCPYCHSLRDKNSPDQFCCGEYYK